MATSQIVKQAPEIEKKKRTRSPNYPTVGLREAIDRVRKFYMLDGRAGAKPEMAAKHIGFASAHGQAYSVLSALKKFGLLEDKDGRIVPTTRAFEIISLPETDERRLRAIREAALSPPIYIELIGEYKHAGKLPHDETLAGELEAYKGFNPNAVKEFLKAFRETLEFSGLSDFSVLGSEPKTDEGKDKQPQVGDWVLPADPPEQPSTQVPVRNLMRVAEHGKSEGAKMRQDVFSLAEGEAVIHWPTPLSPDSITDLEEWLELVKRKIKRSVAEPAESKIE